MSSLKVLFLSHTPVSSVFRVGSHHYARELSKMGTAVAHISTPRSLVHKIRSGTRKSISGSVHTGITTDDFGTLHATPNIMAPIQLQSGGRSIAKIVSEAGFMDADFILIDQPLMSNYVTYGKPTGKIIYRPTDTYSTWPAVQRQGRLLAVSHGVVATSSAVLDRLNLGSQKPSVVIENGVELQRFTPPTETERTGFIYVGAVDYRFDWGSVVSIAEANPDSPVAIVGPVASRPTELPGNVSIYGAVAYDDLPSLLHRFRVGLIPLNASDVNQGRSPMKYYEYLAAGLSVLATSTQALRERSSAQTFLYRDANEASEMSQIALKSVVPNTLGMQQASAQDWSAKTELLLSFMLGL